MNEQVYQNSELILSYLKGELSEDQQAEFQNLVASSEQYRELVDSLVTGESISKGLHQSEVSTETKELVRQKLVQQLFPQSGTSYPTTTPVHRVHFLKRSWLRYAALVLLLAGTATFLYLNKRTSNQRAETLSAFPAHIEAGGNRATLTLGDGRTIQLNDTARGLLANQGSTEIHKTGDGSLTYQGGGQAEAIIYNTLSTPKGGQYRIVLPDGSAVWLNASSSIRFPTTFSGTTRSVEVTGEVYMEIARNPTQVFVVRTADATVQVLGTTLNINAYGDLNKAEVTLLSGSVSVGSNEASGKLLLVPGQQAQVLSNKEVRLETNASLAKVMAWKNGAFDFNGGSLRDAMRQIERWYDIEVIFEPGVSDQIPFSGRISRKSTLQNLLKRLEITALKFRLDDNRKLIIEK